MNRIIFIILLLVNTLFSNTLNEVDLKVLKDLNIEPSFLSNRTLQNTFDEYSSGYNISYYNNFIKKLYNKHDEKNLVYHRKWI